MPSDVAVGYISVVVSVLFFGTFGTSFSFDLDFLNELSAYDFDFQTNTTLSPLFVVPLAIFMKGKKVREANVDPMVFQIYMNLAIFATSWLLLAWNPFYWQPWAILSAALWVGASILSIFAIKHVGISIGSGIWAGSSMVVSFLWGAIVFNKERPVKNIGLAVVALIVLVLGSSIIALANSPYLSRFISRFHPCRKCEQQDMDAQSSDDSHELSKPLLSTTDTEQAINNEAVATEGPDKIKPWLGFLCAVLLGLPNGSMLAPMNLVKPEARGLPYAVSFGIGVLIVSPVYMLLYFGLIRRSLPPLSQFKIASWRGLCAGAMWNVGNCASMVASDPKYLGLTIAFPLSQTALVVGGIWGLTLFKELKGAVRIIHFFFGVVVLLGGAAMLSVFGG